MGPVRYAWGMVFYSEVCTAGLAWLPDGEAGQTAFRWSSGRRPATVGTVLKVQGDPEA